MGASTGRLLLAGGLVVAGMAGVEALASCSSSSTSTSSASSSTPAMTPNASSFSGEAPSALASLAASGQAAASSRAASASAAASEFEASVSAATGKAKAAATAELAKVSGPGNAVADVTLTGVNRNLTGGLHAVVVTITNRSGATASYAVKVEFDDTSGHVVDTSIVGAEDLAAGQRAQPVAFSTKPADMVLIPKLAQAQRY
jgi:hypothetical protein